MTITARSIEELPRAAEEFTAAIGNRKVFAFIGEMGVGKTTFISEVCRCLGVDSDTVASPTFAIVNEYRDGTGNSVYHFDLYRIAEPAEAVDFGIEDYLDSGNLCLIEWPEVAAPLLPDDTVVVRLTRTDGDALRIEM